jgi:hypothetical protein
VTHLRQIMLQELSVASSPRPPSARTFTRLSTPAATSIAGPISLVPSLASPASYEANSHQHAKCQHECSQASS